jgi:excisionase family DNA binding protein
MKVDGPKEETESKPEASSISGIPQQPLFTVKETANIFKVHVRTVERWIEDNCLSAIVLPGGKSLRVPYQEISKVFFHKTTLDDMMRYCQI